MKIKNLILKLLSLIPTFLLLSMIFSFSAQDGEASGSLSFQISLFLVRVVSPLLSATPAEEVLLSTVASNDLLLPAVTAEELLIARAEAIHYYVRKAAHMTEYFLLALSLQLSITTWFRHRICAKFRVLIGFFVTVLLAALDELHQYFVPGRSGNLTDVCIDSAGAVIASLGLLLFYHLYEQKLNAKK